MLKKSVSQNLFFSRKIRFLRISVVERHGRNAKSQILSLENLRGIVRQEKSQSQQIQSLQIRLFMSQKRTVRQRFFNPKVCLFSFFTMPHND